MKRQSLVAHPGNLILVSLFVAVLSVGLTPRALGQTYEGLTAVAATSAFDAWAVGYTWSYYGGGLVAHTLAEHWDGVSWTIVPTPNPQQGCSSFFAVVAISSNDVWAAGGMYEDAGNCGYTSWRAKPGFFEHWDGTTWTLVSSPNPATKVFTGIAAIATNDIWAVGYAIPVPSNNAYAVAEHWDGTQWKDYACEPPYQVHQSYLRAATAVSTANVWAVGSYSSDTVADRAFAEHWDGNAWTLVLVPRTGASSFLYGASASGADNVWATGSTDLAMRWDGGEWTSTSVADTNGSLNAVVAFPNGQAWAAGIQSSTKGWQTLAELWDGTGWNAVPTPNPDIYSNYFLGISGTSLNDIWAVGQYAQARTLIEHWDGEDWVVVPSP